MLTAFSVLDWGIVFVYLAGSLALGVFSNRAIKTMRDYVVAGQNVRPFLGIASLAGTELGLITIMYSAQKGFTSGLAAFHIALIAGVVTFFVGLSGFIVVPLRRYNVLTIPEFYEKRFDKKTRVLGGILLALGGILNMGLFLKVGAVFVAGILGLSGSDWAVPVVMTGLLALVLVYTVLGGMVSVVITDFLQFVLLSFGLLGLVWLSVQHLGWQAIFDGSVRILSESSVNPFATSGDFGWSYVLWMLFTAGLVSCAVWPTAIARALAMTDTNAVRLQYKVASVAFMCRFLIPQFLGICALVYIYADPVLLLQLNGSPSSLYAFPLYLKAILPAGLLGIITAALLSAFMSTHDSYLLCWSSVITQDIIAPLYTKGTLSEAVRLRLTRYGIVGIGVLIWYWGLFYQGSDDIWDYMAITGAIYFTGAFAVLCGGLYWKRASCTGAFSALITGSSAVIGLEPVRVFLGFSDITGAQIGLSCVGVTVLVFVGMSLCFPDEHSHCSMFTFSSATVDSSMDKTYV